VFCTWFLSAAHRSCTPPVLLLASCAKFLLKRSISVLTSFSFLLVAPGLDFKLFRWILACPTSTSPSAPPSSSPGSASASDSRFATSFLFGRRRFCVFAPDFSILLTNEECLIFCLSLFEEASSPSKPSGLGSAAGTGRAARADFARAVVRFFMGAYFWVSQSSFWKIFPD
jgi:hypothetical protein